MMRFFLSVRNLILAGLVTSLIGAFSDKETAAEPPSSITPTVASKPLSTPGTSDAAAHYFAHSNPSAPVGVEHPQSKGDLTFTVDIADVKDKVVRVRGWAFRLAPPHQKGDRVTVLLVGPTTYSAMADVELRPDVSNVLKQPGLDDTGFVGLINASTLPPGEYTIFLQVGGADGEAIKSTNRTLTL
jgi:hypothetical protein